LLKSKDKNENKNYEAIWKKGKLKLIQSILGENIIQD